MACITVRSRVWFWVPWSQARRPWVADPEGRTLDLLLQGGHVVQEGQSCTGTHCPKHSRDDPEGGQGQGLTSCPRAFSALVPGRQEKPQRSVSPACSPRVWTCRSSGAGSSLAWMPTGQPPLGETFPDLSSLPTADELLIPTGMGKPGLPGHPGRTS